MSRGMPRFVANRLAVPAGRTASRAFDPATTSMHRRTVPSPPQAKTSSAPSSSARSTCADAFFAFGTSYQSGVVDARRSSTRRSSGRPPSSVFAACATTATCITRSALGRTAPIGRVLAGTALRAASAHRQRDTRRAARAERRCRRPCRRRRRAGGACRGTCATAPRTPGSTTATTQASDTHRPLVDARRDAAGRARRRRRSPPPCAPTGSSRRPGRSSSRCTCGRSRGTSSDVTR